VFRLTDSRHYKASRGLYTPGAFDGIVTFNSFQCATSTVCDGMFGFEKAVECCALHCLTITGLDWTYYAHHFIFSFTFLFSVYSVW